MAPTPRAGPAHRPVVRGPGDRRQGRGPDRGVQLEPGPVGKGELVLLAVEAAPSVLRPEFVVCQFIDTTEKTINGSVER